MKRNSISMVLLVSTALFGVRTRLRGQAPVGGHRSRYTDQPSRSRLLRRTVFEHGVRYRSGRQQAPRRDPPRRPAPASLSPLYRGQLLVHGMGFSPDRHTLAVVAIGSNAVELHRYRDQ